MISSSSLTYEDKRRIDRGKAFGGAGFGLLVLALLWATWPLASNRPWSLSVLAGVVWLSLALAVSRRAAAGRALAARPFGWALLPLVALAGFAVLLAFQWSRGTDGFDGGVGTVDPFATGVYLLTTLAYLGAFATVLLTVDRAGRARTVLAAVAVAGGVQAVAAVVLYAYGGSYQFLFTRFDQGQRAMGTFANPDHLAGYMELTLAAGIGWLLSHFAGGEHRQAPRTRALRTQSALEFLMSTKMLLRLMLVAMVIVLVMTRSRMGNAAFFLALAFTGAVVAWRSRQLRRPALWLVASMAVVDVFVIGQWVGLDRVVQRLQQTAEAESDRVASFGLGAVPPRREDSLTQRLVVPRLALQLVEARPWFGHGGGSFAVAFPPYKPPRLPQHWNQAHNDFVEVGADTGLVGLALWLLVGVTSFVRAIVLIDDRQSRLNRGIGVAALMATFCMGLHSTVDFNLHIPANALTFTVLLALVWAVPLAASAGGERVRRASAGSPESDRR